IQEDAVHQSRNVAAFDITDLVAAAKVRLAVAKPRKLPREANSRSDVIPIVIVERLVRARAVRTNELVGHKKVQVHRVVGAQRLIEAAPGYAQECETTAHRYRRQA